MTLIRNSIDRMWDHIVVSENCWRWDSTITTNGYGIHYTRISKGNYKKNPAHRYVYEHLVGKIPEGLDLDHLCRNRKCVNPDHLEPVTRSENLKRGMLKNKLKTHCPQGHEYNDQNTYMYDERRYCRACINKRTRRWQKKQKSLLR